MDIKEIVDIHTRRHPWETARLTAIKNILKTHLFEGINVLDVGCGDGFISRSLFQNLKNKHITAVDIHLSDEMVFQLEKLACGITYTSEMPEGEGYDLVLLLDVIEHVEDDTKFLAGLMEKYIPVKSKIMITVPAFQAIYGRHDIFLGHYRRYNLQGLSELARACGLKIISSGYLFSSLLLPKYIFYKLLKTGRNPEGVGNWNKGLGVTRLIEIILNIENCLLISLSRRGIKIPGLTGWIVCEKQE